VTATLTIEEFLAARLETDRGEAQYSLNVLSASAPVMLGSLKSTIIASCERVLADVAFKQAVLARLASLTAEKRERWEVYSGWVDGRSSGTRVWKHSDQELDEIPALTRLARGWAAMYREHSDYRQEWSA
jgi:hypothetical protein